MNVRKEFWKKTEKMNAAITTKYFNFVCFAFATQNKDLDTMKLISKFFFFHQRIYGINFKRIDNGPNSTTISTIAAREIFKKIWKLL